MNAAAPKVSAFVPTYNQKQFVHEAIESILEQRYPNLEIVVGDDGSVDGTQEILLRYEEKYPELFKLILSPKNEGITANCNKILKACSGEYIAFLAGDDIWLPGKLQKQVNLLERDLEASLCVTSVEVFDSATDKAIGISPREDFNIENMNNIEIAYSLGNAASSMMIRRSAIPEYGFEPSIKMVSDWLLVIETLRNGRLIYINEALARYRRHGANTSSNSSLIFNEHIQVLSLLENKYEDMKEAASRFKDKYIITTSILILNKSNDFELKRKLIEASFSNCPTALLTTSTFNILVGRFWNKLKIALKNIPLEATK